MKTSKKVALSVCIFLLTVTAVSVVCLTAFFRMEKHCFDKDIRAAYAGSIDCVFCGTSYAQCSLMPQAIDPVLGCSSYNLSGPSMPLSGTVEILKTELERNPIKTVYVDISLNSFTRESDSGEGEMYAFPRFAGLDGKLSYLRRVDFPTYPRMYANMMLQGFIALKNSLHSGDLLSAFRPFDYLSSQYYYEKGYNALPDGISSLIPEDEIEGSLNSVYRGASIDREYCTVYDEIISLCKEHGARAVFVVIPQSEAVTWKVANADEGYAWFIDYCRENDCDFYDFCLLKDRHQLLSDECDFIDGIHMCRPSGEKFSRRFAEIMAMKENGDDISGLFYSNYDEYKAANPYSLYYTEKTAPVSETDAV